MQMLAIYINEMQRIQEEFGKKLENIKLCNELISRVKFCSLF